MLESFEKFAALEMRLLRHARLECEQQNRADDLYLNLELFYDS